MANVSLPVQTGACSATVPEPAHDQLGHETAQPAHVCADIRSCIPQRAATKADTELVASHSQVTRVTQDVQRVEDASAQAHGLSDGEQRAADCTSVGIRQADTHGPQYAHLFLTERILARANYWERCRDASQRAAAAAAAQRIAATDLVSINQQPQQKHMRQYAQEAVSDDIRNATEKASREHDELERQAELSRVLGTMHARLLTVRSAEASFSNDSVRAAPAAKAPSCSATPWRLFRASSCKEEHTEGPPKIESSNLDKEIEPQHPSHCYLQKEARRKEVLASNSTKSAEALSRLSAALRLECETPSQLQRRLLWEHEHLFPVLDVVPEMTRAEQQEAAAMNQSMAKAMKNLRASSVHKCNEPEGSIL